MKEVSKVQNPGRFQRIKDSFQALVLELEQAIAVQNISQFNYNMARAFRLLSKLEEMLQSVIKTQHPSMLQEINDYRLKLQSFLSQCYSHAASLSEQGGRWEQAEQERLAAISLAGWEHDCYLQYGHTVLQRYDLHLANDTADNMLKISVSNAAEVSGALMRVKFAAQAASGDKELKQSASQLIQFVSELEAAMRSKKLLSQGDTQQPKKLTLEEALAQLDELIGIPEVKMKIKDICSWMEFEQLRRKNGFKQEPIGLHMVFSGNPGTGKTTVARIVGSIFQAMGILQKGHVVEVDRSDLVAEYVGQTAVKTMDKLKEAYEGVLFIDEAYSLTRSVEHDFGIEAVDTIVKEMEDKRSKLVVILAGYPQEMKGFLNSNPGLHSRFNHQIEFDDYSLDELMRINSLMLSKRQYRLTEEASLKLREMLHQEMLRKPHTHGNGRLVRNYLEEMILTKASLTVERKKRDGITAELDLIDSEVTARVGQRLKGKT